MLPHSLDVLYLRAAEGGKDRVRVTPMITRGTEYSEGKISIAIIRVTVRAGRLYRTSPGSPLLSQCRIHKAS